MLNRKSSIIVAIVTVSLLLLLYTSRINGGPGLDLVDPVCEDFPDTSNILLVMKTGASEAYARVPTQLMTILKCLPDFLIFSDMEQDLAGHKILDSLSTVLPEAMEDNSDFDLYRRQKWCLVDQENCNKLGDPAREGWNLDKYKNIHMAEKAYALRPQYDWYVFVDADTYVLWPNLVQWLKTLNPAKKMYLGSVTMLHNFGFGHGGSGYIISKAAMEEFAGKNPGVANKYDVKAQNECCGDYMFALAMKEHTEVTVQQMNHTPLVLRDIYHEFLAPKLNATRADWDNLAENRFYLDTTGDRKWDEWKTKRMKEEGKLNEFEKVAHESAEACAAACESLEGDECFRWKYVDGECAFANSFAMGKPVKREKEEKKRMTSGWDVDKIEKWVEKQGECGKVKWPEVKTDR
ncbi:hypothetical protein N0V88_007162 [Collariella sp. IMI 366227]|nr:hypothetical protein N0V88_007162 [Collariella sp. IMI 366227]